MRNYLSENASQILDGLLFGLGILAVYLGAAPRFTNSRVPFLREGRKEPSPLVRRLLAFLPKRKAAPLP